MSKKQFGKCNECGGSIIRATGGFYVCKECGLAHDIVFDDRESSIYLESGEELDGYKFHGGKVSHDTPHMTTTLKKIVPKRMRMTRLGKLIRRYSYYSREIIRTKQIFNFIKNYCSELNLNNIYNDCCHLFKKFSPAIEFRGRGIKLEVISSTIIYLQCRLYNIPISFNKFKNLSNNEIDVSKMGSRFLKWVNKFNLNVSGDETEEFLWQVLNKYIKNRDYHLKILLGKNILNILNKKYLRINRQQKKILIIAMIYILINKFNYIRLSKETIKKDFNITNPTLRKYVKILKNRLFF